MGFNCLKVTVTSRRQFTFYHSLPRNSWYSFYRPRKDEGLSRPWSHPVVLSTGPLDWEFSILTTRPAETSGFKPKQSDLVSHCTCNIITTSQGKLEKKSNTPLLPAPDEVNQSLNIILLMQSTSFVLFRNELESLLWW